MSLLDFATERYGRPGVKEAMLALQDAHAQSVPLLFWALWAQCEDDQVIGLAVRLARDWEADVIGPLRGVRRKLKSPALLQAAGTRPDLYAMTHEVELRAEGALLDALEGLVPQRGCESAINAMARVCRAWGDPPPPEALAKLASLIG